MERIPILKMGELLLVTIQVDMHDQLALTLQDDLTDRISRTGARGVLIDISLARGGGFVHRPHAGEHRGDGARARRGDGGGRHAAAVAITLVELGLSLPGVRTALNVERGMDLLRGALQARTGGGGDDRRAD